MCFSMMQVQQILLTLVWQLALSLKMLLVLGKLMGHGSFSVNACHLFSPDNYLQGFKPGPLKLVQYPERKQRYCSFQQHL